MAKAKVLKIPARGDWEFAEVETESDGNIPLEAMKAIVGGWVERWELHGHALDGLDLFLDEEGKLKGLSYNPKATILAEILSTTTSSSGTRSSAHTTARDARSGSPTHRSLRSGGG